MKFLLLLISSIIVARACCAQSIIGGAPMCFIENKGQVTDQYGNGRPDIQYRLAAGAGLNIFIGNGAIHYQFSKPRRLGAAAPKRGFPKMPGGRALKNDSAGEKDYELYRMDVMLEGANPAAVAEASEGQEYHEQHYVPGVCADDATAYTYKRVMYRDVYPNIDWALYIKGNQLEYDFIVRPGGNVADIKLRYGGATSLAVTAGSIAAATPLGSIAEGGLYCYEQESGKPVPAGFVAEGSKVSVQTGKYEGALVIDPRLAWATYYGGSGITTESYTEGRNITVDSFGNIYIAGFTQSISNIATIGAYDTVFINSFGGDWDAFLAKFSSGGAINWATYYGDSAGKSSGFCLSVDDSNNIYLGGGTNSATDIATPGTYRSVFGGGGEGFVAKFTGNGTRIWGTYYGCSLGDGPVGMACDKTGNVYVTGFTQCADSIATPGAYKTILSDTTASYIAKFSGGGALLWATYFGGPGANYASSIVCDSGGVYMTGSTTSRDSVATTGAYQAVYGGGQSDVFIAKFNDTGALLWSSYYGGSGYEEVGGIACDGAGNIVISGETTSPSGIATPGAYETYLNSSSGEDPNGFVAKFTGDGAIVWATYFGGDESGAGGAAIDKEGNVYIAGATTSADSVATAGAYQPHLIGVWSSFIAKFSSAGALLWGTYYGEDIASGGGDIACDNAGNFYLLGNTYGPEGIATANGYDTAYYGAGSSVAFIAKFDSLAVNGVPQINAATGAINIFPDPAHDFITASWQGIGQQGLQISISDMAGQQVYSAPMAAGARAATISVAGLPAGVYVLRATDATGNVMVGKMVKE